MFLIASVRSWPLSWKVPLLTAGLMIGIAATISQVVLSRLASDQESNLRALTNAYLDGISAAVTQPVMRGDVWETFDALDRARTHYTGVAARYVIVELPDKRVLAASEPLRFPVRSSIPDEISVHFPVIDGLGLEKEGGRAWLSRTLKVEGHSVGKILAEIDIAALLEVRRRVLWTLILANGAMTLAFAAIGYAVLQRMLRPLGTLTRYVERVREGRAEPIPEGDHHKLSAEFRRLFDRFNAMARALNERETLAARLAAQEKLAVLGKLASAMAHEVNNPLGGIFNALDTLRRHGADPSVRDSTLNLLHRGLWQIRKVVRSTIVTYRPEGFSYGLAPADVDDLRMLVEPEAARKNLVLEWRNEVVDKLPLAVGSVRQATLNLLLNACAASPPGGKVDFLAKVENEALVVEIGDAGPGLPSALAAYLMGEGEAATLPGDGLGLWIVRRLVGGERGSIEVASTATQGTTVRVSWPFSKDPAAKDGGLPAIAEDFVHAG
jgi:signal transduction histidine kinase